MFVKDWMSAPAHTLKSEASLAAAQLVMDKHRIRRLPIVDQGRLVGIITRSDIDSYLGRSGKRDPHVIPVSRAMTRHPATVVPAETLEGAAVVMTSRRISGLPVVEGTRVVGMITETDIFRALIDMLGFNEGGARVILSLQTPESIGSWLQKISNGPRIRSLVTYRDPVTRNWKALVRLWGRKAAPVKEIAYASKENHGRG